MSYLDTNKLVVLCYPRGAGGNFVSNCLALGQRVFPTVRKDLEPLALLENLIAEGSRDYRLAYVLTSLPECKGEVTKWVGKYEFRVKHTYGYGEQTLQKQGTEVVRKHILDNARFFFDRLHESQYLHFITCHDPDNWPLFTELFPNCRQIFFHNTYAWRKRAILLGKLGFVGTKTIQNLSEEDREGPACFSSRADFNVGVMRHEPEFLAEIEKLYDFFGLSDFDKETVGIFYRKYMALHSFV